MQMNDRAVKLLKPQTWLPMKCPGCSRLLLSLAFQQTGEHYGAYIIDHYHPPGSSKRGPADASRKMSAKDGYSELLRVKET